jgi:hypothetical protein
MIPGHGPLRRCGWCQNPFEEKVPLTLGEREFLNKALFIVGQGVAASENRPICPGCYATAVGSAPHLNNNSSLDVGGSNCGPGNFLLKHTYGE